MTKRTCLLIDDAKQDEVFPSIQREGKKYGIEIKCLQFNVGHPETTEVLTDQDVDIEKVIQVFEEKFKGEKIDLIAFDWNLSSSAVNGPLIIKAFNDRNIRFKVPKILYSGILKEEVEKLCDAYRKNPDMPFKEIWAQINTLISTGILTFVSRTDYEIAIAEQLRKIDDTVDTTIEELLRQFPGFKFQNAFVSKQFRGLTFAEILKIIEGDRLMRNSFTKEITQQVIAYLTEKL